MHCTQCGAEVDTSAKFCSSCGATLSQPAKTTVAQVVPSGEQAIAETKRWTGGMMLLYVLLSAFIPFVGIGLGAYGLLRRRRPVGQAVALIIISAVSLVIYVRAARSGESATTSNGSVSQAEVAVAVDYHKLYQDYQANPIKADATYKGKRLTVSGRVAKIDREIMGEPYVTFAIDDYFRDVRLTFEATEEQKVASLAIGQAITVTGTCQGTLLSTTVALKDCVLDQ